MQSIKYSRDQQRQLTTKWPANTQNYQDDRLKINPSFFANTFQTQNTSLYFGQPHEPSTYYLPLSTFQHHKNDNNSWTLSQIKSNIEVDSEAIMNFMAELKLIQFASKQNKESQQYIVKQQKNVAKLNLQLAQMEELLKAQNQRYAKKQAEFKAMRLRAKSRRQKNNQEISAKMDELSFSIQKMRRQFKYRLKTQPINPKKSSKQQKNANSTFDTGYKQLRFHYPQTMPIHYHNPFQRPIPYTTPLQGYPFQSTDNDFQWMRINDSNSQNTGLSNWKMKTEATYESRPIQQLLSESKRRRPSSGRSTPHSSRIHKKDSIKSSKNKQSQNMGESADFNKIKEKRAEDSDNCKFPDLRYLSQCESQNESQYNYIALNIQKSHIKSKPSPKNNSKNSESSNMNLKKVNSQSEQWMQLMVESKQSKSSSKKTAKNPGTDLLKVYEDKSQKYSQRGSSHSKVNVTISSEQQRQKQTIQSSSDSSKKRLEKNPIVESVVAISLSGVGSSKISKRSRANSANDVSEKQTNRYMPHLSKEFMRIQEENEDIASLKATPNQFGTPRANSQNQKAITPTNSQKHKRISTIQQEQEISTHLMIPSTPQIDQVEGQQRQGLLSKIQLKNQSKNKKITFGLSPQDDDLLAGICLVGQSKISRLKSSSQHKSIDASRTDFEEMGELKAMSQLKKEKVSQDLQFDDFNFELGGQSNIVKRVNRASCPTDRQPSPSKGGQSDDRNRFSTSSFNQNMIQQKEEQQEDSPSNNERNKKRKH